MRGLSTNKFAKFHEVMEELHDRKWTEDQKIMNVKSNSCNRTDCKNRASTFYIMPLQNSNRSFEES